MQPCLIQPQVISLVPHTSHDELTSGIAGRLHQELAAAGGGGQRPAEAVRVRPAGGRGPEGEPRPTAAVPMENTCCSCKPPPATHIGTRGGASWLTAAAPVENTYCSCKLTRVRRVDAGLKVWLVEVSAVDCPPKKMALDHLGLLSNAAPRASNGPDRRPLKVGLGGGRPSHLKR